MNWNKFLAALNLGTILCIIAIILLKILSALSGEQLAFSNILSLVVIALLYAMFSGMKDDE